MLKTFIIKLLIVTIIFVMTYLFFVDKLAKGYVDPNYNKFTQEAGSLIIGLSRANEGISPYIIEAELKDYISFEKPLINFALNEAHFGEVYYNAITKKTLNSNNGIFILSISPGNFTAPLGLNGEKTFEFDKRLSIGKINNFTSAPNYDYIINNYETSLYNTLHNLDMWNHRTSHKNGWNEIKLKSYQDTIKDKDINYWKSLTLRFYEKKIKTDGLSEYRYEYFIKTIQYLKTKGTVFLTRIPSDEDLVEFGNKKWVKFDVEMDSISSVYNIPYFNYSKQSIKYKTYDGSHLESESAKKFSKVLSDDIKSYLSKKSINE